MGGREGGREEEDEVVEEKEVWRGVVQKGVWGSTNPSQSSSLAPLGV